MNPPWLCRMSPEALAPRRRRAVDAHTLESASSIVEDMRQRGDIALREYASRLDGLPPDEPLAIDRTSLEASRDALTPPVRALLERVADRIRAFAVAQRAALSDLSFPVAGGHAGHTVLPVAIAGCYAPGGRYPLVSSTLMTVVTARAAGVGQVWACSPRPTPVMRAAAAIAGADGMLCVGGAHAIAALAYGAATVPACDVVVGPGNRWVTAAKHLVSADVGIDLLAGPSELLILADDSADPHRIAADLLAQAEHDPDAVPMLVTTQESLIDEVERVLSLQLAELPSRDTAASALRNGFAVVVGGTDEGINVCNRVAAEHVELHVRDPREVAARIRCAGAVFLGEDSAEVLGDYGAGPNHTLPTGGTARYASGLSVFTFLRCQTWLRLNRADVTSPPGFGAAGQIVDGTAERMIDDAAALARLEGLEGHARSAELRRIPASRLRRS
ncbi:MAG: histidinol dehydrogenase [Phycisphaerae bacterium]|nr:MAG: histidinol dehydrogenase [Phycisphaerae bacterium]MBE7458599.1 histidinol dehydrogenase [Planctomycetia bacterium]MCK6465056.1 histidinol dehydrogenase [Phycisphaerae bacterium]MCL4718646.1 histidinol dehydrogenase [Phycisphaerae bacterium]NUQ08351.1 histidinol dehydrogenase [Phycisphaerae bacterium]